MDSPPAADAPTLNELHERLPGLTGRDRRALRRRLQRLAGEPAGTARDTQLASVAAEVAVAEERVARRRAVAPQPTYPADLPIAERREEILAAVRDHQVVIVAGETGSGKSTQLPKLCLELGRGITGLIGHTQPRRLAARTVAERIAEELGGEVGGVVGYAVRFTDKVGPDTLVKLMTDGILLNEIQRDRLLEDYDTLIIDEAHERSLNIDFILGYLKTLLPRRPDLKVIVTSATIDTARFSRHFDDAPVVEVSGRTYPVEVRYRPLDGDSEEGAADRDQIQAIGDAVQELAGEGPGDILVFLSGEREIRDTAEALAALDLPNTELLPLYARLSAAEQHRAFQPHRGRRVVLATNVAETSLTVPGIRYVIDPGNARISRYNRRTKVQRLPIEAVSQASANQRAGRCGRVAPGICIRLYDEDDYAARPLFTEPEILRTNLASVILQMAASGLGDIAGFPFVEPPEARNIADGIALLEELGAVDPAHAGTRKWLRPLGRQLAQLPVDPRLGRMILEADRQTCLREVIIIAAALSIQDPRERPIDKQQAAAERHARFADPDSDFLAYLRLWEYVTAQQQALGSNQFRRLCRADFLNFLRIREWQDIAGQLRQVCRQLGLRPNHDPAPANRVHRALLGGLLSHIGVRDDRSAPGRPSAERNRDNDRGRGRDGRAGNDRNAEYLGARNARFALARGSALSRKPPRWVMAAELVETNRLWARTAARIQAEWLEQAGAHLLKRTYGEPHWDPSRGSAVATERVTLYGIPIVESRWVSYRRVDAAVARELFIRHALVEGDWETHHDFLAHNRKLMEEVRALEDRARRRDILLGDDALFRLYDERVGPEVASGREFDGWWRKARQRQPELLRFTLDELIDPGAQEVTAGDYPDQWRQGPLSFDLAYAFEPGSEADGVTVVVPLPVLNQVATAGFDWQVPGLREELVTALIRSLPKGLRRHFVPAPEHARDFLARSNPADGPLLEVLARDLRRTCGEPVPLEAFQLDRLPEHLRVTFQVVDETGQPVATGKDLGALESGLRGDLRASISRVAGVAEQAGLTDWTVGTIPPLVEADGAGHRVRGFPALVDEGATVALRLLPGETEQWEAHWAGTRRLLRLTLASPAKSLKGLLSNESKLVLALLKVSAAALADDCIDAALDHLLDEAGGPVWDEAAFVALRNRIRPKLAPTVVAIGNALGQLFAAVRAVEAKLVTVTAPALRPAVADVREQLANLVYPGFVTATGPARLTDLVRYVRAMERRLDKLTSDGARDLQRMVVVRRLEAELDELAGQLPPDVPASEVQAIRWLIEELRVSFFAQTLGTALPVSETRITKAMDDLAAGV